MGTVDAINGARVHRAERAGMVSASKAAHSQRAKWGSVLIVHSEEPGHGATLPSNYSLPPPTNEGGPGRVNRTGKIGPEEAGLPIAARLSKTKRRYS